MRQLNPLLLRLVRPKVPKKGVPNESFPRCNALSGVKELTSKWTGHTGKFIDEEETSNDDDEPVD
jgi:hypothetical protein